MKTIRSISFVLLMFLVMTSFSQCSSAKDLQEKAPVSYDQVYYQNWIAGVEGGGAGTNLFIPISGKQVDLDPVGASVDCRARHREAPAHEGTPWLADEMAVKADVGDCVEAV